MGQTVGRVRCVRQLVELVGQTGGRVRCVRQLVELGASDSW